MRKADKEAVYFAALNLLKENTFYPGGEGEKEIWTCRRGPWGREIRNLLLSPDAGPFVAPDKRNFTGQWYWDTMGINLGLLRSGDISLQETAVSMVKNLFYLYDSTGLIPNAADSVQNTRSQPPFLSSMCIDIADHGIRNKTDWYRLSYDYCKKEVVSPWEEESDEFGFQWFDRIIKGKDDLSQARVKEFFRPESRSDYRVIRSLIFKKIGRDIETYEGVDAGAIEDYLYDAITALSHKERELLTEWLYSRRLLVASGMDFTASYGLKKLQTDLMQIVSPELLLSSDLVFSRIIDVSPVDLNCLIHKYYIDLAEMASYLGKPENNQGETDYSMEAALWEEKRSRLQETMMEYNFDASDGLFWNYDKKLQQRIKSYPHITQFSYPLYCEVADEDIADKLAERISTFITGYGLKFTQVKTGFQWDYNMWPLQTWITVEGLKKYGYDELAINISKGYIQCIEKVYSKKFSFYEKYNAETGDINTDGRYPSAPDFSWTAAVYIAFLNNI